MFHDYSMSVMSQEMGKVPFHLTDMNGFHIKVEKEKFSAVGSCCCQKFKTFTPLFGSQCKKNCSKEPHMDHDYFSLYSAPHKTMPC